MDGKIMLLSHTLTICGSHVANLVKFCPVLWEEIGCLDIYLSATVSHF